MRTNLLALIIVIVGLLGGVAVGHAWGWIGIAVSDYKDLGRTPAWTRNYQ